MGLQDRGDTCCALTAESRTDYDTFVYAHPSSSLIRPRRGILASHLAITLFLAIAGVAAWAVLSPVSAEEGLIPVKTPAGVVIYAELADTTEKRARGLMFRNSLAKDRGMLFTFTEPKPWAFWMKNTKIPLDIIWLDSQKRIVHIERNVPLCTRNDDSCPQYQPTEEAMYVLEIAGGMADALKLQRGATLQFP